MTNAILIFGILAALCFAIYDQVIMPKRLGETRLAIPLQKQAKTDSWILIGLFSLSLIYGIQHGISAFTLYLLGFAILLTVYLAFLRSPRLLLKQSGFFFGNVFFEYQNIAQINLAENQILVIDMKNGRRLLVRIENKEDVEKAVWFFGGYKK
nr:DUF986 family protein [uncultured Haemophilus sp.]